MATSTREPSVIHHLPPAESTRLLDFDAVEVRTLRSFPPQFVLVVHGMKPFLNMQVELVPLVFVQQPEYWGIEVVGRLPGIGLPALAPYTVSLSLAGVMGTKGIEVIGATRAQRMDLPPAGGAGADAALTLELAGSGAEVTYAEDADGAAQRLTFRDAEHELTFAGEDIRVLPSELGRQATVGLDETPDVPAIRLTLIVPPVRFGATTDAPVATYAIVSTHLDTAFTAGPREGQRVEYRVLGLAGTARSGTGTGSGGGADIGCRGFGAGSFRHGQGGLGLRVTGTCTLRTAGHRAELRRREPQGINPDDLLLELVVTESSEPSTDALTDVEVLYEERRTTLPSTVTILPDGDMLEEGVTLPVVAID